MIRPLIDGRQQASNTPSLNGFSVPLRRTPHHAILRKDEGPQLFLNVFNEGAGYG